MTVLAPGLLGASLGMAARRLGLVERVVIWARRPEARVECEAQSWCDAVQATPEEAVRDSDLVVLCPPVDIIEPLCGQIAPHLANNALVTDVGSTKSLVSRQCHALMPPGRHFVGSHPMAGSEKSGLAHADTRLFARRACFVTPLPETDPLAAERVVRFWRGLEMIVTSTAPEQHDEIVAHISHLPHMLASALSVLLSRRDPTGATWRVAACATPPGWRPVTR